MKIGGKGYEDQKFVAGLSAAVLAATMMSVSVSAAKLGDVVHPSEEDSKMNDSYYSIGAMGFYMGQDWTWNQGDWVGIDDAGKITVEYKISKVITDKTMSGKGTLGDMGVMVANLPDGIYPVDVKISDAKFVAEDGTTTVFDSLNSITSMDEDAEGGIRIHIRPTDEVNEETGEVTKKACPEVAGWEKEGAFNGGTLSMTLDFGVASAEGGESKTDTSRQIQSLILQTQRLIRQRKTFLHLRQMQARLLQQRLHLQKHLTIHLRQQKQVRLLAEHLQLSLLQAQQ